MGVPRYQPRYTLADYEHWEGDWELWAGAPVAMSPSPTRAHQRMQLAIASGLAAAVAEAGCGLCQVVCDLDWRIDEQTVVRPDIVVSCDASQSDYLEQPPVLAVEVLSPATAVKDRTAKRALYAEQGVQYYILAAPDGSALEVLRLSTDGSDYEALAPASCYRLQLTDECRFDWQPPRRAP